MNGLHLTIDAVGALTLTTFAFLAVWAGCHLAAEWIRDIRAARTYRARRRWVDDGEHLQLGSGGPVHSGKCGPRPTGNSHPSRQQPNGGVAVMREVRQTQFTAATTVVAASVNEEGAVSVTVRDHDRVWLLSWPSRDAALAMLTDAAGAVDGLRVQLAPIVDLDRLRTAVSEAGNVTAPLQDGDGPRESIWDRYP